jgi:alpha-galactosidase
MWQQYKRYTDAGIDFDLCWRDAGWYPCGGDWPRTGTWEVDKTRFPQGFRPFSDFIHKQGKKLIVWFEPERVGDPNSWLAKNHPEWLLGGTLLNLGDPTARTWLTDHIDSILATQGIDDHRQDFNIDPRDFWRRNDAPDRQGITENLYVQGYLAYWDELRRRHPDMLIDSCASGGRRNDLETLRRAVPLLRSDYQFGYGSAVGNQGQTYGISSWIPYYGSGIGVVDTYNMRSFYVLCCGFGGDNMALVKQGYEECAKVAPCMLGDYYPLTPYSLQADQWIAWQFNQPGHGDGVVQAFRRDKCDQTTLTVHLQGLDPRAHYEVTNFDAPAPVSMTGQDLMVKGLTITLANQPAAAVFRYQREKQ